MEETIPGRKRELLKIIHSQDCTQSSVSETRVVAKSLCSRVKQYWVLNQFCKLLILT